MADDRSRGDPSDPSGRQIARDDDKLDLNAQGRQGSGSTDRDQASNVGSGFNEGASDERDDTGR